MSCHHVTNISLSAQKLPSCLFAAIASPTPAPGTTYLLSDNIFPRISCKCLHVSVHAIYILSLYLASFAQHGRLRCIHTFGCINNNFLFVAAWHSWHGHTWNLLIHSPLDAHLVLSSIACGSLLSWMMLVWTSMDKSFAWTCLFIFFPRSGLARFYV